MWLTEWVWFGWLSVVATSLSPVSLQRCDRMLAAAAAVAAVYESK